MANLAKKNERKSCIEYLEVLKSHMLGSLKKGKHTVRSMNDSSRISSEGTENPIWGMMHFLNVSPISSRSKSVEVVADIDSKKSFFPYWYEEKILANLRIYVSKILENSLTVSPSRKKKVKLLVR